MPLRIGFDMDGVLADFSGAFREHAIRLFGPSMLDAVKSEGGDQRKSTDDPEEEEERQAKAEVEAQRESRRRED